MRQLAPSLQPASALGVRVRKTPTANIFVCSLENPLSLPLPRLTVCTQETTSLTHPLAATIHERTLCWLTKFGNTPSPHQLLRTKIDLTLSRADHRVVYVDLAFTKKVGRTTDGLAIPGFDAKRLRDPKVIDHLRSLISHIDNVPWAIDPDSHANYISWQLRMALACAAPISKAGP